MKLQIPNDATGLTADWLADALRLGGVVGASAVRSVRTTRIGEDEGFTGGTLQRVEITYGVDAPAGPRSLVAKLSPSDAAARLAMKVLNVREAEFYAGFATAGDMPVPRCYYADYDAATGACILLLEDLSAYRLVPFLEGCRRSECEAVIRMLAVIHARWWNRPQLRQISGADLSRAYPFDAIWPQYPDKLAALLPDVALPASFFAFGDLVAARQAAVTAALYDSAPFTLLHRDVQPDNLLFQVDGSSDKVRLLDWQLAGRGRPAFDVGFFLATSVEPDLRRQIEGEMVQLYQRLLVARGVDGYGFERCWADYQLGVLGRLSNDVGATVLLDNASPHKMAWRRAALNRLLAFLADHPIAERVGAL